jgi:hypothetical protein
VPGSRRGVHIGHWQTIAHDSRADRARRAFFAKDAQGEAHSGAFMKNVADVSFLAKVVHAAFRARLASSAGRSRILNKIEAIPENALERGR